MRMKQQILSSRKNPRIIKKFMRTVICRNLLELTYSPPEEGYCSSSCPGEYYANSGNWQCNQCYQGSGYPYYTCKFDMLRRKLQPMQHRMQFRLFSTSSQRILANLATVVDRGLTTPYYTCATCSAAAGGGSSNCE
jgi:hypothetical protein